MIFIEQGGVSRERRKTRQVCQTDGEGVKCQRIAFKLWYRLSSQTRDYLCETVLFPLWDVVGRMNSPRYVIHTCSVRVY